MPAPPTAPVTLQACLNGSRPAGARPAVPVTPGRLAAAAVDALAAGADGLHVHQRDADGAESVAPDDVAAVVTALRDAVGPDVEVGVTTGLWAAPDAASRHAAVAVWPVLPDAASVNWNEEGAVELAGLLLDRGVGVDAGLWAVDDAVAFLGWPRRGEVRRILVEAIENDPAAGVATAAAVVALLHRGGVRSPLLVHGLEGSTWPVLRWAAERGHAVRIGLEDTLELPDGAAPADNAALVRAAAEIVRAASTKRA